MAENISNNPIDAPDQNNPPRRTMADRLRDAEQRLHNPDPVIQPPSPPSPGDTSQPPINEHPEEQPPLGLIPLGIEGSRARPGEPLNAPPVLSADQPEPATPTQRLYDELTQSLNQDPTPRIQQETIQELLGDADVLADIQTRYGDAALNDVITQLDQNNLLNAAMRQRLQDRLQPAPVPPVPTQTPQPTPLNTPTPPQTPDQLAEAARIAATEQAERNRLAQEAAALAAEQQRLEQQRIADEALRQAEIERRRQDVRAENALVDFNTDEDRRAAQAAPPTPPNAPGQQPGQPQNPNVPNVGFQPVTPEEMARVPEALRPILERQQQIMDFLLQENRRLQDELRQLRITPPGTPNAQPRQNDVGENALDTDFPAWERQREAARIAAEAEAERLRRNPPLPDSMQTPHPGYGDYLDLPENAEDPNFDRLLDRPRTDTPQFVAGMYAHENIFREGIHPEQLPDYILRSATRVQNCLELLRGANGQEVTMDNIGRAFDRELERFKNALHNLLYEYKKDRLQAELRRNEITQAEYDEQLHREGVLITNLIFRTAWQLETQRDQILEAAEAARNPVQPEQQRERNICRRFMDWYGSRPWWGKALIAGSIAGLATLALGGGVGAAIGVVGYRAARATVGGAVAGFIMPRVQEPFNRWIDRRTEARRQRERQRLEDEARARVQTEAQVTNFENKNDVRRLMSLVDDEARQLVIDLKNIGINERSCAKLAFLIGGSIILGLATGAAFDTAAHGIGDALGHGTQPVAVAPDHPKPGAPGTTPDHPGTPGGEPGNNVGEVYSLKAGDNLWKVTHEQFKGTLTPAQLHDAWVHSTVAVDGVEKPISQVWLVHPNDHLWVTSTPEGYRFHVANTSGMQMGDVAKYHSILVDHGTQPGAELEKAYHHGTVVDHFNKSGNAGTPDTISNPTQAKIPASAIPPVDVMPGTSAADTSGSAADILARAPVEMPKPENYHPINYETDFPERNTWLGTDNPARDTLEGRYEFFGQHPAPRMTIQDLDHLKAGHGDLLTGDKKHFIAIYSEHRGAFDQLHEKIQHEMQWRDPQNTGVVDRATPINVFCKPTGAHPDFSPLRRAS